MSLRSCSLWERRRLDRERSTRSDYSYTGERIHRTLSEKGSVSRRAVQNRPSKTSITKRNSVCCGYTVHGNTLALSSRGSMKERYVCESQAP